MEICRYSIQTLSSHRISQQSRPLSNQLWPSQLRTEHKPWAGLGSSGLAWPSRPKERPRWAQAWLGSERKLGQNLGPGPKLGPSCAKSKLSQHEPSQIGLVLGQAPSLPKACSLAGLALGPAWSLNLDSRAWRIRGRGGFEGVEVTTAWRE